MTYPRRCPLCQTAYAAAADLGHVTVHTEPGGTPSPQYPELPGRLLTLHCRTCRGEYPWDFFADAPAEAAELTARRPGRQPTAQSPLVLTPRRR